MPDRRKFHFVPASWAEVYTLLTMFLSLVLLVAGVTRFYAQVETLTADVSEIKTQLAKVSFPVIDEKIRQVNDKVDRIDTTLSHHLEEPRDRLHR